MLSDDYYPDYGDVDYSSIIANVDGYADSAINVLEGVSRGFLTMVVPVVGIGICMALVKILMKAPIKAIAGDF